MLMKPLMEGVLIAGLGLAGIFGAYGYGHHVASSTLTAKHKAELAAISQANSKAVADAVTKARAEEQDKAAHMAALDFKHFQGLQDEIDSKNRTIADLHAGTVRVRDNFACPAATAKGAAAATGTSTRVGDAAGAGGLQAAHVEFLLREAGRADEAVKQLEACQAIVKQDRGQ